MSKREISNGEAPNHVHGLGFASNAVLPLLTHGHLRRTAQVQCGLFRAQRRSWAPFDGAVNSAAHLVEPPCGAGAKHLASPVSRSGAGLDTVQCEIQLRAMGILAFGILPPSCRICRSVANVFHSFVFLRLHHRTGGWTSIG